MNSKSETDHVADVFGPNGYLSKQFEGYEPRTGQVELAYVVLDAMQEGFNVVAEAPTGTGKSIGYGMPAVLQASKGERTVVVTANIALQEQLVQKDLPLLQKALPWSFTFAIAKGMNNYLCLDAFTEIMNETILNGFDGSAKEREQWDQIVRWGAITTTGDVSELPFEAVPTLKPKFSIMSEDCIGKKCPHHDECFAMKARSEIQSAGIVVTNYALFFIDLEIKRNGGEGVLPRYTHVVFDEGHKAADLARGFMGFRMTRGAVSFAIKLLDSPQSAKSKKGYLPSIDESLKKEAMQKTDTLFALLSQFYHSDDYSVRFRREWRGLGKKAADAFVEVMKRCSDAYANAYSLPGINRDRANELMMKAGKCQQFAGMVEQVSKYENSNEWIYFLSEEGDRIALKSIPISVAEYLRANLFEAKAGEYPIKSVTVTSATLATSVDDYSFVCGELGIRSAEQLTVESPFDIVNNTLLVCPAMPAPQSPRFAPTVASKILSIIQDIGGRTLCLFTSWRNMNLVWSQVCEEWPDGTILKQGDAPRMQLIERFKRERESVLFGTESFWAGVDVPGESLSCVVIDKLPFPNLGDPLQDVLKEKHGNQYFGKFSVPIAVIAFRQGAGRLLRTSTDRGAVVVLDSRIVEKGYGSKFIRSFPKGTQVVRHTDEVRHFLEER